MSQLAKRRMLQSRFGEAAECAREALAVARAVDHHEAEAIALNALGTALGDRARPTPGVGHLRESLAIAREHGFQMEEGGAWINIADVLALAGRTEEALAVARQGLEAGLARPWRTADWLGLAISEYSFQLGDWDGGRASDPGRQPAPHRRHLPLLADLPGATRARPRRHRGRRRGDRRPRRRRREQHRAAVRRDPTARCARSSTGAAATWTRPGRRWTKRSTASSTAPRTSSGSPCSRSWGCAWTATPGSRRPTAATSRRWHSSASTRRRCWSEPAWQRSRAASSRRRSWPPAGLSTRARRPGGPASARRAGRAGRGARALGRGRRALGRSLAPLPRGLCALARGRGPDGRARSRGRLAGRLRGARGGPPSGQCVAGRGGRVAGRPGAAPARRRAAGHQPPPHRTRTPSA